jgi:hypothetical protein
LRAISNISLIFLKIFTKRAKLTFFDPNKKAVRMLLDGLTCALTFFCRASHGDQRCLSAFIPVGLLLRAATAFVNHYFTICVFATGQKAGGEAV